MAIKNRTLYVLKYIWENSDEEHQVTAKDIMAFLKEHGMQATSRTIKADVDQLIECGFDIEINHSTQNRFYMYERHFEMAELKILIDAVQSAKFITEEKSKGIIEKLAAFASRSQRRILERSFYVDKRVKTENKSAYYTLDSLHEAIRERKKVSFKYLEIAPDKSKKEKHRGQVYLFSPYALIWNEDCYYVIGYSEAPTHKKIVKFRVDRIKGLTIEDVPAVKKPKDFSVEKYFTQVFSMYDGPAYEVDILCDNDVMKYIIDRFGEKVQTKIVDNQHFQVTVTVNLSPTFYGWLFSFAGKMKLLSPAIAVEVFQKMMNCVQ